MQRPRVAADVGRSHGTFRNTARPWACPPWRSSLDHDGGEKRAAGGKADTFDLPKMGITGNTHMLMMDRNSDKGAKLINDWLGKQGLIN
jgi:hypothetical protein